MAILHPAFGQAVEDGDSTIVRIQPSTIRPSVTLDTFTVENAGSSLLFSGDQSLTSKSPFDDAALA